MIGLSLRRVSHVIVSLDNYQLHSVKYLRSFTLGRGGVKRKAFWLGELE